MSGYKPTRRKAEFEKSPRGKAHLHRLENRTIGVHFSPENDNDWADKKFRVTDWPSHVNPKLITQDSGREWYVSLGNDKKSIYSISPMRGMYTVRFTEFSAREGELPMPQYYDGQYPYHYFDAVLEVVDGDPAAQGKTKPYRLRYDYFL